MWPTMENRALYHPSKSRKLDKSILFFTIRFCIERALCTNFTPFINKSIYFNGIVPASINIIVYLKHIIIKLLDVNLTRIADYGST